jgi:peptidyl-prolyl cis-trans isomerase C
MTTQRGERRFREDRIIMCELFGFGCRVCSIWSALGFTIMLAITATAEDSSSIAYYSTSEFSVTEFDREMYLRNAPPEAGRGIGSRARNLSALSDLYAIKLLALEARSLDLLSEAEKKWLVEYAISIELIERYLRKMVEDKLAATDWEAEARDQYIASPEDYWMPESVSLRTLLIRTENRSESEAMGIAVDLLDQATRPGSDFIKLVNEHTEDPNAAANGGLMSGIVRGQTVPPFEEAAFALRTPGEFSEPVVSQFGVHLIQLVEYTPAEQLTFEQVAQRIIDELKPIRAAQYRRGLQEEARERKPEGFVEHTKALDELMSRTSDGALGR